MPEFILKYADARGQIHQQVAEAATENDLREKYSEKGFLIYSVKPKSRAKAISNINIGSSNKKKKVNLEKFLIFNQQFVTLIRAGLPILKSLDLLSERLTDEKLSPYVKTVRDEVRNGALLSDAFARPGAFPAIYVTSIMAGEKSGALVEVLDRYITYQKLNLAVRKKIMVSLIYPVLLIILVILLIVFLVTYVVPNFAELYNSMNAQLPAITQVLIAVGTTAKDYILVAFVGMVVGSIAFYYWAKTEAAQPVLDKIRLHTPLFGEIWIKYQVAQFARVLSTLLIGGIPLVQALETAGESVGASLIKRSLEKVRKSVREGQTLYASIKDTGIFPGLAVDMIEVGESTGALPAMLGSVAEFYEDDVQVRMQAMLSLIEPAIMIFMGIFVAFVLVALYLPSFSLADHMGG